MVSLRSIEGQHLCADPSGATLAADSRRLAATFGETPGGSCHDGSPSSGAGSDAPSSPSCGIRVLFSLPSGRTFTLDVDPDVTLGTAFGMVCGRAPLPSQV